MNASVAITFLQTLVELGGKAVAGFKDAGNAFNEGKRIYDAVKAEGRDPTEEDVEAVRALYAPYEEDFMTDDEPDAEQAE